MTSIYRGKVILKIFAKNMHRNLGYSSNQTLSLVFIWSSTYRDCVASVVEIESESISTTLATQSRHVHDHMETRLYVDKHLFLFITLLSALTIITAVKCGMCSVKLNQNNFKSYKIGLLEIYWMQAMA